MIKKFLHFFDKTEDKVRGYLSAQPIFYAMIGGVCIVLFWRGVWHTGDIIKGWGGVWAFLFYEPVTVLWTTFILLLTGLFVSVFIGDSIILSGIRHEKKFFEKNDKEIEEEFDRVKKLEEKILALEQRINERLDRHLKDFKDVVDKK